MSLLYDSFKMFFLTLVLITYTYGYSLANMITENVENSTSLYVGKNLL